MSFLSGLSSLLTNFGGLFGSALSAGSSAYGTYQQLQGAREANATNAAIAAATNASNAQQVKDLMSWQENMSNTAYQRQMADMKTAGINPMLSASMGGASTPPGASIPQITGAPMQNTKSGFQGLQGGVTGAMDAIRTAADIKNLAASNSKIKSDTALNDALTKSAQADKILKSNSARAAEANAKLLEYKLPGAKFDAELDNGTVGHVLRLLERIEGAKNSAKSVASGAKSVGQGLKSGGRWLKERSRETKPMYGYSFTQ